VFALTNLVIALVLHHMWTHVAAKSEMHKDEQAQALSKRVRVVLRFFVGILVGGVLVSLIDVRAGIACFLATPALAFYGYVRDPLRARQGPR